MEIKDVHLAETFIPVVSFTMIRTILEIIAMRDSHLHQMNVKTALLNGEIEGAVHMEHPAGLVQQGKEQLVCRLKKALYGLRQALRQCYAKIYFFFVEKKKLKLNDTDECVHTGIILGSMVVIALYVDDFLIASPSIDTIDHVERELSTRFGIKDIKEAQLVLGFEIHRDSARQLLYLTRSAYKKKIFERFGMDHSKQVDTPMEAVVKLTAEEKVLTHIRYRQLIGCLK